MTTFDTRPPREFERADPETHEARTVRQLPAAGVVISAWVAVIAMVWVWGTVISAHTHGLKLGAIPLFGRWHLADTRMALVPVGAAVAGIVVLPRLSRVTSLRRLLALVALAVVIWSAALSWVDGPADAYTSIRVDYRDHTALVDDAGGVGPFLANYVDDQSANGRPTHLQAHPPGLMVGLWALDQIGTPEVPLDIALAWGGAALASVSALVVLASIAGKAAAQRAAPFLALAPAAIWHNNADCIYAGLGLLAVALLALAVQRNGVRRDALAVASGVALGAALLLTYGVVLLVVPMAAICAFRRTPRPLLFAGATATTVVLLPSVWGFAWLAGLVATRAQYEANPVHVRPFSYFVVANLAIVALAIGPAAVVGMTRLRERGAWIVVGSGLAAVVIADVSGLANGEVERIWQPFFPLLLLATCGLVVRSQGHLRVWLAAQAVPTVALQLLLRSPW